MGEARKAGDAFFRALLDAEQALRNVQRRSPADLDSAARGLAAAWRAARPFGGRARIARLRGDRARSLNRARQVALLGAPFVPRAAATVQIERRRCAFGANAPQRTRSDGIATDLIVRAPLAAARLSLSHQCPHAELAVITMAENAITSDRMMSAPSEPPDRARGARRRVARSRRDFC